MSIFEIIKEMGIETRMVSFRGGEPVECIDNDGIVALWEAGVLPNSPKMLRLYRLELKGVQSAEPLLSAERQRSLAVDGAWQRAGIEFDVDFGPN